MRLCRLPLLILFACFVVGCYAETAPPSNIEPGSAKLNALGYRTCGVGAISHFEYSTSLTALKAGNGIKTSELTYAAQAAPCQEPPISLPFGRTVNTLMPGVTYYFRVCGRDVGTVSDRCAASKEFTTPFTSTVSSDPKFTRGLDVGTICNGRDNSWPIDHTVQPGGTLLGAPEWKLGQHFSFYDTVGTPVVNSTGPMANMWRWTTPGKTVAIRKGATALWDAVTEVNTINEYKWNTYHIYPIYKPNPVSGSYECQKTFPGYVRDTATGMYRFKDFRKWVHLYTTASPKFADGTKSLDKLTSINYDITVQLQKNNIVRTSAYGKDAAGQVIDKGKIFNAKTNIIHYLGIVHFYKRGPLAEGERAHHITLMVPIYHSEQQDPGYLGPRVDPVTQGTMVRLPKSAFTTQSVWSGQPVRFQANILPWAKRAIAEAFPNDKPSDYSMMGYHMGYEANGIGDVQLAFRNFKLEAQ